MSYQPKIGFLVIEPVSIDVVYLSHFVGESQNIAMHKDAASVDFRMCIASVLTSAQIPLVLIDPSEVLVVNKNNHFFNENLFHAGETIVDSPSFYPTCCLKSDEPMLGSEALGEGRYIDI